MRRHRPEERALRAEPVVEDGGVLLPRQRDRVDVLCGAEADRLAQRAGAAALGDGERSGGPPLRQKEIDVAVVETEKVALEGERFRTLYARAGVGAGGQRLLVHGCGFIGTGELREDAGFDALHAPARRRIGFRVENTAEDLQPLRRIAGRG